MPVKKLTSFKYFDMADPTARVIQTVHSFNPDLKMKVSKYGVSFKHEDTGGKNVLGIIIGNRFFLLSSRFLTESDSGVKVNSKGYPIIRLREPTTDKVEALVSTIMKRAKLCL